MSGATGRPAEILRERSSVKGSGIRQFQAKGFYVAGFLCLVLAALKLTEMKQWSWWRVLLPLWVVIGHNAMYLLVGFFCLFALRNGEENEKQKPAKVQGDHISYQAASVICVLIATDNLLRWAERGESSDWFWLFSGSMTMVVLFGALAAVAQVVYWTEIVRGLNDQPGKS